MENIMKKLHLLALVPIFAFTTHTTMADPVDSGPPGQQQKDAVTDSTSSGNYLEDEAGSAVTEDTTQATDMTSEELQKKNTKTNSPEKGKSHNKQPVKGGVEVK